MQFFKIQPSSQSKFVEVHEHNMQYEPMCLVCKRGGDRLQPLSIAFNNDKNLGDFTWLAPDVFVSEKAKSVLKILKLKDFNFNDISVYGKRQEIIWQLEVRARCHISSKCGIHLLDKCPKCGRETFSTWIDGLRVDGDVCNKDVFRLIEHWGMIFFSERVVEFIRKAWLTNIEFIPMENVIDDLAWMRPRK